MGFLGILRLGGVLARRGGQIRLAKGLEDRIAGSGNRFAGHLDTVGTHIGDEPDCLAGDGHALIEPLGNLHGPRRRKAELARRLLLERGSPERRIRMALDGFALDRLDSKGSALECCLDGAGGGFIPDVESAELLPVDRVEPGGKYLAARCHERAIDGPVFLGLEGLDLKLAVADEA